MSLSLADMVMIGLRLVQYRNEISNLTDKIFGRTQIARTITDTPKYDVRWVQLSLNHLMHPLKVEVDGKMGKLTEELIAKYQQQRGLQVDGWLGPVTMAALDGDIRQAHKR